MFKEFKEFIQRGNVMDMAVGVIIGASFAAIVKSLVDDIIMPFVGIITGGIDFSQHYIALDGMKYRNLTEATESGASVLRYGLFINTVISFIIIAFIVFLIVRCFNRMRRKNDIKEDPTTKTCHFCQMEIPIQASRCPHCTSELK